MNLYEAIAKLENVGLGAVSMDFGPTCRACARGTSKQTNAVSVGKRRSLFIRLSEG